MRPLWICRPTGLQDLVSTITDLETQLPPGTQIRAAGSLHSWSDIAKTNGALITTDRVKGLEPADCEGTLATDVPVERRANLFRVLVGSTVEQVNEELWNTYRKAFPLLGGFDGQRLGGLFPTGTHGSVLAHGPLAEMIRSIDLIAGHGQVIRIEPSHGITSDVVFRSKYPHYRLIQDDNYFDAALIHLGAYGVSTSYVIEVRDAFYLQEIRTTVPYHTVQETLRGGQVYDLTRPGKGAPAVGFSGHPIPAYHLELLVNPYGNDVLITTRDFVPPPTAKSEYFVGRPERNLFRAAGVPAEFQRPMFITWLSENFPGPVGWVGALLSRTIPRMTPAIVNNSIRPLVDKSFIHRSYRVFNIGDGQNRIPALSATIFVPLEGDLYLDALDVVRREAGRLASERRVFQDGPIALRFVKGSRAMMAPPVDVCAFEFIFAGRPAYAAEVVSAYVQAVRRQIGDRHVWVHWGQLAPTVANIPALYPRYSKWRRIRDSLDPEGQFLNDWLLHVLPAGVSRLGAPRFDGPTLVTPGGNADRQQAHETPRYSIYDGEPGNHQLGENRTGLRDC